MELCAFENCKKFSKCRGYCKKHYDHLRHKGIIKKIPLPSIYDRIMANTKRSKNGCLEVIRHSDKNGYGMFKYKKTTVRAHRIVYAHHKGLIPKSLLVCHKCDNPRCVEITHLFLGTAKDNSQDCLAKGRLTRGVKHHKAKLTNKDVRAIRASDRDGVFLADKYKVTYGTIWFIKKNLTWRHLL